LCVAASSAALATPGTTVTGRSDVLINTGASFIDQVDLSIIDVKLLQCIKIRLEMVRREIAAPIAARLIDRKVRSERGLRRSAARAT
jgi:hypothetical protein